MEFVELRLFSALSAGQRVGPESSILKTRGTEIGQYIQELAVEAIGYWSYPFIEDTFDFCFKYQIIPGSIISNGIPVGPPKPWGHTPFILFIQHLHKTEV